MANNKYQETISVEELQDYELSWFKDEIVVVENIATFKEAISRLRNEKLLGFDTETRCR